MPLELEAILLGTVFTVKNIEMLEMYLYNQIHSQLSNQLWDKIGNLTTLGKLFEEYDQI